MFSHVNCSFSTIAYLILRGHQINAARVRAGDLAPIELVRTRVAAIQLNQAVIQAETRWRVAQNRLQALMGRAEALDTFEAVGDIRRDDLPPGLSPLLSRALDLRPDLRALRAEQARTLADLKFQIAQGKIEYTVGVEYRRGRVWPERATRWDCSCPCR